MFRVLKILLISTAVAGGLLALMPATAPDRPVRTAETQAACTTSWQAVEQTGLVRDVQIAPMPTVTVDEVTFRTTDFDTKAELADILNCIAAGPGNVLIRIDFVSDMTNERLARWTPGKGLVVN